MLLGHVRAGVRAVVAARDAVGLRVAAAQAGPGPDHARAVRSRSSTTRRWRTIGIQPGRQRAVHVLTGWESAGRPDPRAARLLGRLRGDGRAVAGRRRRARARDLDDRRRPRRFRDGYLGDGRRPLRRLRDAGLHERQGPGELPAPVPDHLPERGAARRPAAADDADPRPPDRRPTPSGARPSGSSTRCGSRSRACEPKEEVTFRRSNAWVAGRGRGRRGPRAGRHDRDLQLRQVPGHRAGRRGLAVVAAHRADAGARPDHADRDAQRRGPDRRRVHGRAGDATPTSSTCSDRCRPRSTTRAGSATTCRPTGPSGSRCWGWA